MANKENTEKSSKQHYKTEISRLEKEIKDKDRTIYDLRCRVKSLERQLKVPKRKQPKPATNRESAIEKAKQIRNKLAKERKPE